MKVLSKEIKEMWSKVAEKYGKGKTWREIEMQQARLLVEGERNGREFERKLITITFLYFFAS